LIKKYLSSLLRKQKQRKLLSKGNHGGHGQKQDTANGG
jgi:hypothetical protein